MLKRSILFLFIVFIGGSLAGALTRPALSQQQRKEDHAAVVQLGKRLFRDDRFSTPNGDLPANCAGSVRSTLEPAPPFTGTFHPPGSKSGKGCTDGCPTDA